MARGHAWKFLAAFLRHPNRVGAIAPSSSALARMMIEGVALNSGECLVELGPGTGSFTKHIREILPSPSAYLGIETEARFTELLGRTFPDLEFRLGSAENAKGFVEEAGHEKVAAIISGLPFASLPDGVQQGILSSLEGMMREGAVFRTFQYLHAYMLPRARSFRRRMTELFGPPRTSGPVLWNLPPALVLSWLRRAEG